MIFGNFVADFKFTKSISGVGSSSSQGMMAVGCGYGSVAMEKSFRVIYINVYIHIMISIYPHFILYFKCDGNHVIRIS